MNDFLKDIKPVTVAETILMEILKELKRLNGNLEKVEKNDQSRKAKKVNSK
jgi:hypothetical protein